MLKPAESSSSQESKFYGGTAMFFNTIADTYDEWYKKPLGQFADQVETKLAFTLFQPQAGEFVLDVGCGTGNFSLKLAQLGAIVTGIDISEEMLAIAREKALEDKVAVTFKKMDVYNLDFPDSSFSAVFSMAAFEFIHEPQQAFAECMRVLKPGGKLLIGTINKESTWGRLYEQKAQENDSIFRFARFKTLKDLEHLDRRNLIFSGECLFIPPDSPPDKINWEEENRLSTEEKGGFIVALWKKPS